MALPIREGDIPGIQLRARRSLAIGRAEAWRWLTEPSLASRWLADRVESVSGPRGGWRLERDVAGRTVVEIAETSRFEPERAWALQFRQDDRRWEAATRLEITLEDAAVGTAGGGGCDLDLLQRGFHLLAMSSCLTIWEEYRHRWREALDRLARETG